ncbi:MAG: ROK family protein [Clostridia bacterium]|nr:ROK family protein [Clostridia bacterium]
MKIGIDLGGSHVAIGVINSFGIILEKDERRILEEDKNNICQIIEDYIYKKVKEFSSKYSITLIGIAIPGTVDNKNIIKSVNLGIENYGIVEKLSKRIEDIPIKIMNDAKCAALAEKEYGQLKQISRGIFISLGTGIGGAVIINNQLLDAGSLPGIEIGHMVIKKDGLKCNCGNRGCFERYASMKALKINLRRALNLSESTSGKELLQYLKLPIKPGTDGNISKVSKVIDDFIDYLCIGIGNMVNIFEPEEIVIGGSFVYFEDIFLDNLKQRIINGPYLFNKRKDLVIKTATLGNDAGIIGASLV